ncbi:MAG: hypothetical protein ABI237_08335 [Ginsengibacter sp.]
MMIKKIGLILMISIFCQLTSSAQTLRPDSTKKEPNSLFGFNGKKKNDSTLVTGSGATVTFHNSENQISVQLPPGKDPFKKMADQLDNTDKDAEKDAAPFLKQVQYAPIATVLTDAYKQVKEEYKEAVSNTIQLPKEDKDTQGSKEFEQHLLAACPAKEIQYKDIMNFIKQHEHDKSFNVTPPPTMDYENCWSCHPSKQSQYDTLVEHYYENTFKEEIKLTKEALGLARQESLLGMDNDPRWATNDPFTQELDNALGSSKHPTACTWMRSDDPMKAAQEIVEIAFRKADYLFHTYRKDFSRLSCVTRCLLRMTRQRELITGDESDGDYVLGEARNAVSYFCSIYTERIFLKEDFTQWPNMKFLMGLVRQSALLGNELVGNNVFNDFQKYDRFKLSMDVNVKAGKGDDYEIIHLQGDNYVALVPDSDTLQCLRMVEASDNNPLVSGSKKGELKMKLLDAELTGPGPTPKFVSPHDWQTALPTFILHDCDNGKDSMSVNPFYSEGNVKETWSYPQIGNRPTPLIQGMLGAIFSTKTEVEHMQDPKVQEEMKEKIMANSKQIQAMLAQMQQEVAKNGKVHNAVNMQKISDIQALMHKSTSVMPDLGGRLTLETPIHNPGPTMIDITYDGKKDSEAKDAIIYATYKLKMAMDTKK